MFRGAPVSVNFWFEDQVDAYLAACAAGKDWRKACAEAEARAVAEGRPRKVLTQIDLREKKGIRYSRQHIARRVRNGSMPPPFNFALPLKSEAVPKAG